MHHNARQSDTVTLFLAVLCTFYYIIIIIIIIIIVVES